MSSLKRYRAHAVAGLALSLLAACGGGQGADPAEPATPAAALKLQAGPELVQNGDFGAGLTGWNTWLMNGGDATYAVKSGKAVITIHASATDYSGIQLSTGVPFALEQGKTYRLSFRAKADYPTRLRTSIWENGTDLDGDGFAWSTHAFDEFSLTDTMTRFTAEFTMTSSDPAAGLCFFLGDQSGRIFLDDVSLVEVIVPPLGTELVRNGKFSSNLNQWSWYLMNGGQATFGVERKQAVVNVTARATDYSGVQLQYVGGLPLVAGRTYRLSFQAHADVPGTVMSSIWENGHDLDEDGFAWSTYQFTTHAVGTAPTTYTVVFTMSRTNLDAGIAFFLGEATGKVYFDDVSLVEIEPPPPPPPPENLIHDGGFDQGLTGWTTYLMNGGDATYGVSDGRGAVTIASPATDYSGIQLSNNGLPLEAGKSYRLTFRAGTDGATGPLSTSIWENGHDTNGDGFAWSTYGFQTYTVGPEMQTFTYEFTLSVSNPDAGLCFFLGSLSGTVFVDDVDLREIPPIPPPPPGSELVQNGAFDAGLQGWNSFVLDGASGTVSAVNGEAVLATTSAGAGLGSVQVDTADPIALAAGRTYRFTFRARSDAGAALYAVVWDGPTSTTFTSQWLSLGPDMTTYTFDFTAPVSATSATVAFLAGDALGQVVVDDVSLIEVP